MDPEQLVESAERLANSARALSEQAVQVLSQLAAPARESGGAEAGEAVAHAARAARALLRAGAAGAVH